MNESRAAIRYAKAILSQAVENKATEAVDKDMRSVVQTISDSKELQDLLGSPVVKGEVKKSALLAVFSGFNTISEELISLLVDNKRVSLLKEVAEKFIILNEKLKGQGVAYVTTVVPLTSELEAKILTKLKTITADTITIENTIDENIIGGFVLRYGDLQFDASIAHKLNGLKREFTNSL
ncbi:ATP synthase F1 subunit delta [Cellulophaga sp. F20128]|uniref:ATP synthase F1 subunit delta n=1 Tax=Cellulophaga sp. F20128 TaxID=2926413 RepID=UPI001FF13839|nr:ATP synthase F1 subunit delta [Cellulophaga sp. F20128]MCK0155945.1 ATP synthase F1 subunit delta [Cellulophaga sp. F20128]